jgi:hypothetical protein
VPVCGFLGRVFGRRARVRRCTECATTWSVPLDIRNPAPRNKGFAIGELYSASRLLSNQFRAGAREEADVRDAFAHCPQCGSGHFTELRERR